MYLVLIPSWDVIEVDHEHCLAGNCVMNKRGWRAVCGGLETRVWRQKAVASQKED
jgi:hypothetical protein